MPHKFKKYSTSKKRYLAALLVLLLIALMTTLDLTNTTHFFHKQAAVSGTIPTSTKPTPTTNSKPATSTPSTSDKGNGTTTPTTNVELVVPSGNFVSNHSLPLSDHNFSELSLCNTSPGATCLIEFKMGTVTRTLKAQVADSNGTVYWQWSGSSAGLTEGQWQISATASTSKQTMTALDPRPLDVQP